MVNVALPSIAADFEATTTQLSWVVSGYNISLASLLLLSGRLADRLGRRRMFAFGLWGFLAGSALEQQFVVVFLPASVLLGFGAGAAIAGLQSAAATRQAQVNT